MIFEFMQNGLHPNTQKVYIGEKLIGIGLVPKYYTGTLNINNTPYTMAVEKDVVVMKRNDKNVGTITEKLDEPIINKWLSPGLRYFEFEIDGRVFTIYHIGFHKKDYDFYQMMENGKTVGMIQKTNRVVNHRDHYVCYIESDDMLAYLSLMCLFLQGSTYFTLSAEPDADTVDNKQYVAPRAIRDKYDKDFISRVLLMEQNATA